MRELAQIPVSFNGLLDGVLHEKINYERHGLVNNFESSEIMR